MKSPTVMSLSSDTGASRLIGSFVSFMSGSSLSTSISRRSAISLSVGSRRAPGTMLLRVVDLVDDLELVDRDADGPDLALDRADDALADPPRRVRRELEALV
jgi:hypothetical protein